MRLWPLALLLAASTRPATSYPDWFIRMPPGGDAAVGYAPHYGNLQESVAEALDNARATLHASSLWIRAEYLQEVLPGGAVAFRGEHYEEQPLGAPADSAVAVDTVVVGRMVMVLAQRERAGPSPRRRAVMSAQPPAWVGGTPKSTPSEFWAVGAAEAHYNEHEAWLEAERQARRSLAYSFVSNMRSVLHTETGGTSNGALATSTAVVIRGLTVRERWRDERRVFVLVRADRVEESR